MMPAAELANEDLMLKFTQLSPLPADLVYGGDVGIDPVKVVPVKSTAVKLSTKWACIDNITLTWAVGGNDCPWTSAGSTFVSGSGNITPTALHHAIETKRALRKGDLGQCGGQWINNATKNPEPCFCQVEIIDAGQDKVKGE